MTGATHLHYTTRRDQCDLLVNEMRKGFGESDGNATSLTGFTFPSAYLSLVLLSQLTMDIPTILAFSQPTYCMSCATSVA